MIKCSACDKEFTTSEGLTHHQQAKHGAVTKKFTLQKKYYWYAGTAVVVILFGFLLYSLAAAPGKYDDLATCLREKGVTFYGAFWCPHCTEQKQLFGKSAKLLPYVECSTPDGKGQLPICITKDINGYPTWEFTDGTRLNAILPPEKLAELAGCQP